MYHTCLFCAHDLQANDVIETLPIGRRVAFDSVRGRLWVVCLHCERWNLTPFETRWDTVEMCERIFRDQRKRITTDQIGLAKLDEGLELVRIGEPLQEEFAAWRYGDQFGRRRRRMIVEGVTLATAAGVALAGAVVAGAAAGLGVATFHFGRYIRQQHKTGQIVACVPTADGDQISVSASDIGNLRLKSDATTHPMWRLVLHHQHGTVTLGGDWAVHALGLLMPTINGNGGSAHRVHRALKRLEAVQQTDHLLHSAAAMSSHGSRPGQLGTVAALPVDMRLAVEIAANERNERYALEGEMWVLELAWERAELVAGIADGLLVPSAIEKKLQELKTRQTNRQ